MDIIHEYWSKYQRTKDSLWIGKILEHYSLILFGVAMRYMKNPEQAKDIVQQVYLIALEKMPTTKIKNIGGWLYIVTKNEALQKLDQLKKETPLVELVQYENVANQGVDQAKIIDKKETVLWEAINSLNEDQKFCVVHFFIKNWSYQQIEDTGKYSMKEVKSNIQNGKRNLKIKLGDHPLFQ